MSAAMGPPGPRPFSTHGIAVEEGIAVSASGHTPKLVSGGSMVMSRVASGAR
jgi:hypothetical protein